MTVSSKPTEQIFSPDRNASGLIQAAPDALRYDCDRPFDPDEVSGIVADMIPAGSRVLDVGCGGGLLTQTWAERCKAEFVGIEPDPARAARAAKRGLEIHVGYLTEEIIPKIGSFDIVVFADVLEHLPNPHAVLLVSRMALKPRGAVIVSVPNVAHWSVRLSLLRGIFQYRESGIMDATHLRWFTRDSIQVLLAASGFRTIQYRGTAGPGLPENEYRAPLSWLSMRNRTRFLRAASRKWPTLFGAQQVLKGEMQ
jgi:methionine biosynthesis protein MetW